MFFFFSVWQRLTYNLDSDAGCGLTSLILQDYLVVAAVLSLCDVNRQAGLVTECFSSDTMARVKNYLEQKRQKKLHVSLESEVVSKDYWMTFKAGNILYLCIANKPCENTKTNNQSQQLLLSVHEKAEIYFSSVPYSHNLLQKLHFLTVKKLLLIKDAEAHPFSLHPHHPGCWFSADGDLQAKFVSCHDCHRVIREVQALQVHPWWVCRKLNHQRHVKYYAGCF